MKSNQFQAEKAEAFLNVGTDSMGGTLPAMNYFALCSEHPSDLASVEKKYGRENMNLKETDQCPVIIELSKFDSMSKN